MITRRSGFLAFLSTLLAVSCHAAAPADTTPLSGRSPVPDASTMRDLFDRWEKVWHDGAFSLVPSCVADHYIRHDETGDRTVTREAYTADIDRMRHDRPGVRIVVYDHSFAGDRAWFRFAFKWTDAETGEPRTRAGMQAYRIENGKLAETWLAMQPLGSAWSDTPQDSWTSQPAIR